MDSSGYAHSDICSCQTGTAKMKKNNVNIQKAGSTVKKNKVTSSDVAKASGVSQATVSMILNKKYNVSFSKETVEKVEHTARELGYDIPK